MSDLSDPAEVKDRTTKARLRQRENDEVLYSLCSTVQGRRWIFDLLGRCHVFTTSFRSDPHAMAFAEGERNVGLSLIGELTRVSPKALTDLLSENMNNG